MNDLQKKLLEEFQDEEYAHGYMESHVHDALVGQIYWTRKARGWTQAQLAEKAGMTQERISKIESGDFVSLNTATLRKLARAFDVSLRVGFEPFSHGIWDVCTQTKERLNLPSRLESLQQLGHSVSAVTAMYSASPVIIHAISEGWEKVEGIPGTSTAVTAPPPTYAVAQPIHKALM